MDGRLLSSSPTGVGTYARSLKAALVGLSSKPVLLIDRIDSAPFGRPRRIARAIWPGARRVTTEEKLSDGWRRYCAPDIYRLAQIYFDIHRRLLPIRVPGPAGIAHWTYPLPLHIVGWHNIYTIHDLIPLTHPGLSPINPSRYERMFNAITSRAAALATVSSASAEVIRSRAPARLPVINCGQPVLPGAQGRLPNELSPREYILVVGSVEHRKNIPVILDAYRASGVNIPLVIAGPDGWGAEAIAASLSQPGIIRLPYLATEIVRSLIGEARMLVMMSRAEGFGLPVAEAMTLGTPVITTNEGALAEISGDACINVAPSDVPALADAMRRLSRENELWSDRRAAGLIRAETFDPKRFEARLAHLYATLR